MKPLILGHRGASGNAPENTATAFYKAYEKGADGVEFDLQMTADGEIVVIHDEKLDRTTEAKGFINDMKLSYLKSLDIGSHFSSKFKNEKILTLSESFEIVKDFKVINLELKNGMINYKGMEKKVLEVIKDFGLEEKVIISSFNHYSINKIKELSTNIKRGILYYSALYKPWHYAQKLGVDALHPYFHTVNKEIVKKAHENDIKIVVYGANKEKDLEYLIDNNVDMIITDYPKKAIKIRDK